MQPKSIAPLAMLLFVLVLVAVGASVAGAQADPPQADPLVLTPAPTPFQDLITAETREQLLAPAGEMLLLQSGWIAYEPETFCMPVSYATVQAEANLHCGDLEDSCARVRCSMTGDPFATCCDTQVPIPAGWDWHCDCTVNPPFSQVYQATFSCFYEEGSLEPVEIESYDIYGDMLEGYTDCLGRTWNDEPAGDVPGCLLLPNTGDAVHADPCFTKTDFETDSYLTDFWLQAGDGSSRAGVGLGDGGFRRQAALFCVQAPWTGYYDVYWSARGSTTPTTDPYFLQARNFEGTAFYDFPFNLTNPDAYCAPGTSAWDYRERQNMPVTGGNYVCLTGKGGLDMGTSAFGYFFVVPAGVEPTGYSCEVQPSNEPGRLKCTDGCGDCFELENTEFDFDLSSWDYESVIWQKESSTESPSSGMARVTNGGFLQQDDVVANYTSVTTVKVTIRWCRQGDSVPSRPVVELRDESDAVIASVVGTYQSNGYCKTETLTFSGVVHLMDVRSVRVRANGPTGNFDVLQIAFCCDGQVAEDRSCLNAWPHQDAINWAGGVWQLEGNAEIVDGMLYLHDSGSTASGVLKTEVGTQVTFEPGTYIVTATVASEGTVDDTALTINWIDPYQFGYYPATGPEFETYAETFLVQDAGHYYMDLYHVLQELGEDVIVDDVCVNPWSSNRPCLNNGPGEFASADWELSEGAEIVGGMDGTLFLPHASQGVALFTDETSGYITWEPGFYDVAITARSVGANDPEGLYVQFGGTDPGNNTTEIALTQGFEVYTATFALVDDPLQYMFVRNQTLHHIPIEIDDICINNAAGPEPGWDYCWVPAWEEDSSYPGVGNNDPEWGPDSILLDDDDGVITADGSWPVMTAGTYSLLLTFSNPLTETATVDVVLGDANWEVELAGEGGWIWSEPFTLTETVSDARLGVGNPGFGMGPQGDEFSVSRRVCLYYSEGETPPPPPPTPPSGESGCEFCPPPDAACTWYDVGCWLDWIESWAGCIWCAIIYYGATLINYVGWAVQWAYQTALNMAVWLNGTTRAVVQWLASLLQSVIDALLSWFDGSLDAGSDWLWRLLEALLNYLFAWLAGLLRDWLEGLEALVWFLGQLVAIAAWLLDMVGRAISAFFRLFDVGLNMLAEFKAALDAAEQDLAVSLPCGPPTGAWTWHLCRGLQLFDETVGSTALALVNGVAMGVLGFRVLFWTFGQIRKAFQT